MYLDSCNELRDQPCHARSFISRSVSRWIPRKLHRHLSQKRLPPRCLQLRMGLEERNHSLLAVSAVSHAPPKTEAAQEGKRPKQPRLLRFSLVARCLRRLLPLPRIPSRRRGFGGRRSIRSGRCCLLPASSWHILVCTSSSLSGCIGLGSRRPWRRCLAFHLRGAQNYVRGQGIRTGGELHV